MNTKQQIGLLILRVSIASTMLVYGITKLIFGNDFITSLLNQYGLPSFLNYGFL
jgi:putative oxidoreductase